MKFYYHIRLLLARRRFERADKAWGKRTVEQLIAEDVDVVVQWALAREEMAKWLEKLT